MEINYNGRIIIIKEEDYFNPQMVKENPTAAVAATVAIAIVSSAQILLLYHTIKAESDDIPPILAYSLITNGAIIYSLYNDSQMFSEIYDKMHFSYDYAIQVTPDYLNPAIDLIDRIIIYI